MAILTHLSGAARTAAVLTGILGWSALAPARAAESPDLLWHVVAQDGTVIESHNADLPFNPASVVKVATTLWALERLGPDHRFLTGIATRGGVDAEQATLHGDLVVHGGDDPDFHAENGWLVSRALNAAGIQHVDGALLVDRRFNFGWEGGLGVGASDPDRRARVLAGLLRDTFDPTRWSRTTRQTVLSLRKRAGIGPEVVPSVTVGGGVGASAPAPGDVVLLSHRSNPLRLTLKRFNTWSNNDIERLGAALGTPADLAAFLQARLGDETGELRFETLSGLGTNRMTARTVTRLLAALGETAKRLGLEVDDLLPVAGCGPGTLSRFPRLNARAAGRLVAKTGTLTTTDGGVAALAGYLKGPDGVLLFSVAAPGAGAQLAEARRAIEEKVLRWAAASTGGAEPVVCDATPVFSDSDASVEQVVPH